MKSNHIWKWETSSAFTTKSAYRAYFNEAITFKPWRRSRKSWVPGKCKTFLWLAICSKYWSADPIKKNSLLPDPENCPLCDQEDQRVSNIFYTTVLVHPAVCCPLSVCKTSAQQSTKQTSQNGSAGQQENSKDTEKMNKFLTDFRSFNALEAQKWLSFKGSHQTFKGVCPSSIRRFRFLTSPNNSFLLSFPVQASQCHPTDVLQLPHLRLTAVLPAKLTLKGCSA